MRTEHFENLEEHTKEISGSLRRTCAVPCSVLRINVLLRVRVCVSTKTIVCVL
jgi:hypothetical protein